MSKMLRSINKILETIGRATYKSIFWTFKSIFNAIVKLPKIKFKLPKIQVYLPKKAPKIKLTTTQSFILSIIAIFLLIFYWFILKDLPSPSSLTTRTPSLSTKIYDRNHKLLFVFYKDKNRTLIDLKNIPDHFIKATLAIEDSKFYEHKGFSLKGIIRSLNQTIFNKNLQGGSTITQQLVKNALLTHEQTITRKIKELILSIEVEILYSKDQILEMYFNEVSYGGTSYGAEQASQTYFNKSIKDVNLSEAALLAGLPAAPTIYSPFGSHPYLSLKRQHKVLNRMVEEQYIAPLEAEIAKSQKIKLAAQTHNILAPHFVMYIKELLVNKFGEALVEQGGLSVTTSLDLDIQKKAQNIVTKEINNLFPLNITNGAALVTKPSTGEILAMIGSRDYFDDKYDGRVNLTTSLRQPGSSIKPVNYAIALNSGYTLASIINDSPVTYDIPGSKPYSPINYDSRFHGPITLRSALANSYNIPAVKLLASYGVDKMIKKGQDLGITTWTQPERYGLSLTLGGAEIKMTDMAVVFGTFANQGQKIDLHPILKVTDSKNKILLDFYCKQSFDFLPSAQAKSEHINCKPRPIISPSVAFLLNSVLSDQFARIPAFGPHSYLNIPNHQVAVKTGTTNDKRDNWTIGYTKDFLVATWVGNNDNSPMSNVASGITGASPIWNKIITELLKNKEQHIFTPPPNIRKVPICTLTGQLTCNGCPTKNEYFISGTEPKTHCNTDNIKAILKTKEEKRKEKDRDKILDGASQ